MRKKKRLKKVVIIIGVLMAVALFLKAWIFPPYEAPAGTGDYVVKMETFT